jgi:hypothetical protein
MTQQSKNVLKKIERDENGLVKDVEYYFTEEGLVDWRKMIPDKYLYSKGEEQDISKVDDSQLIIKLGGMRYIAQLRGMLSYKYEIHRSHETYAAVICTIYWLNNFESKTIQTSAVGSATLETTNELTSKYVLETAQNRAFCRAVREYLNIPIVSQEEISNTVLSRIEQSSGATENEESVDLYALLNKVLTEKGITFDWLKERLIKLDIPGAEQYNKTADIPKSKLVLVIDKVKKFKPSKVKA